MRAGGDQGREFIEDFWTFFFVSHKDEKKNDDYEEELWMLLKPLKWSWWDYTRWKIWGIFFFILLIVLLQEKESAFLCVGWDLRFVVGFEAIDFF